LDTGTVLIRRPESAEYGELRRVRLAALAEAPWAFCSSYDVARHYPDRYWLDRIASARGAATPLFAAAVGDRWVGMVGGTAQEGAAPQLVSLWVEPEWRGRGVVDELVAGVADWARSLGHRRLRLWVTEVNASARSCYERLGFHYTGQTIPYERDPSVRELEMELPLG
jgi:GNAT superfamily N-acetyltransferase